PAIHTLRVRGLPLQRQVFTVAPLSPGSIIVPHPIKTEEPQGEQSVRRTDASLSIGNDLAFWGDPRLSEHGPQFCRRLKFLGLTVYIVEPFEVHGAGNAATPLGVASIGAGPFLVRTNVKESAVGATDRLAHVV